MDSGIQLAQQPLGGDGSGNPPHRLLPRLADLLVEALELGSGKHEPDELVAEIFRPFGIDFYHLATQYRRARPLRQEAAKRLTEEAPSAEELINEVVRCGGRFVDMVQDVYRRLARHAVTAGGKESDNFRLQRAGVNNDELVISEAFIERVRSLQSRLRSIAIGALREADVRSLINADGGRLYGGWPIRSINGRRHLADEIVTIAQIAATARDRVASSPARQERVTLIDRAQKSADRLVTAAENLLRSHIAHADLLAATDAETAVHRLFSFSDQADWIVDEATAGA